MLMREPFWNGFYPPLISKKSKDESSNSRNHFGVFIKIPIRIPGIMINDQIRVRGRSTITIIATNRYVGIVYDTEVGEKYSDSKQNINGGRRVQNTSQRGMR